MIPKIKVKRPAVLVSLSGTNLASMIDKDLPIPLVVADRECRGLEIAKEAGIQTELVLRTDFSKSFDYHQYALRVIDVLKKHEIDLVVMAGFMTIFAPVMFLPENFKDRVLNSHPSLLPKFKGAHAVRDTLAAWKENRNVRAGTTIHIATEKLDDGEILAQKEISIIPGDTEETLHERIKQLERELYPEVLRKFLA